MSNPQITISKGPQGASREELLIALNNLYNRKPVLLYSLERLKTDIIKDLNKETELVHLQESLSRLDNLITSHLKLLGN